MVEEGMFKAVSVTLEFRDKFELEFLIDLLRTQAQSYDTKGFIIRRDSCDRIGGQLERYIK